MSAPRRWPVGRWPSCGMATWSGWTPRPARWPRWSTRPSGPHASTPRCRRSRPKSMPSAWAASCSAACAAPCTALKKAPSPGCEPVGDAAKMASATTRTDTRNPMIDPASLASHGPVIPVIVLQRVQDAVPLAEALLAGGVKVLEVTLRTPVALQCIAAIAKALPEALVGAGTVRSAADAQAALDAGSRFAVSPGYTAEIGAACRRIGLPLLPRGGPASGGGG